MSNISLGILCSDFSFRLWNISENPVGNSKFRFRIIKDIFYFCLTEEQKFTLDFGGNKREIKHKLVAFQFGNSDTSEWSAYSVFFVSDIGTISFICPVIPNQT